ncbi:MAG: DUF2971 domain-containing protein [Candidatus Cloacimonadota bacterium]|nr:DUF2971 domain-containing protein [Candidatus Cloacimonadota bacterium]
MGFWNSKSQKKWQKTYINNVFANKNTRHKTFSKIILNNPELLNQKNTHFPKSLFKFYSPTSDNIIDIKKQRLWFAHPSSFNDPFDCHTGYDVTGYEKYSLLEHIKKIGFANTENRQNGFTKEEFNRIYNSIPEYEYNWMRNAEEYWSAIRKISESKNEEFEKEIYNLRLKFQRDVERKIEKLREVNIRIACFSDLKSDNFPPNHNDFEFMIHMWSHYASNHEGFCVEYDITQIHPENLIPLENKNILGDENAYISNKTKLLLSAGLFPVIYTSNRVNIPKTKLKRIKIGEDGNIKHNSDVDSLLYKTYIIKSAKWNYEKEWRIIVDGDICKYFDNKIHFPYIKKIFLGCKMNTHNIDILLEIAEELDAEVVLMAMNDKKFYLEPQRLDSYKWNKERRKWNNPLY